MYIMEKSIYIKKIKRGFYMEMKKSMWKKPEIVVINLKDYERVIIANARSGCGASCGVSCSTSCGCLWVISAGEGEEE